MELASFLITTRETLEAALVVGIVLTYLYKTDQRAYARSVYWGVLAGIVLSIVAGFIFIQTIGSFTGMAEELFEGVVLFVAVALLTTLIIWHFRQRHSISHIHSQIDKHLQKKTYSETFAFGLSAFIAVAVLREGIETVIFFSALDASSGIGIIGAVSGVVVALLIGYLFFLGTRNVPLKHIFTGSVTLLILFAGGLVANGIELLQGGALLPTFISPIWDISLVLPDTGTVGTFFVHFFGYDANPSLLQVLGYIGFLLLMYMFYKLIARSHTQTPKTEE